MPSFDLFIKTFIVKILEVMLFHCTHRLNDVEEFDFIKGRSYCSSTLNIDFSLLN
jgi:hypothetical protein